MLDFIVFFCYFVMTLWYYAFKKMQPITYAKIASKVMIFFLITSLGELAGNIFWHLRPNWSLWVYPVAWTACYIMFSNRYEQLKEEDSNVKPSSKDS